MGLPTLEESVSAAVWREEPGKLWYRLQVDNVFGKLNRGRMIKQLKDWQLYGEGFGVKKSKQYILLFRKKFDSHEEWIKWAKNFPFNLVELNRNGNPKRTKLGAYLRSAPGRPRKESK